MIASIVVVITRCSVNFLVLIVVFDQSVVYLSSEFVVVDVLEFILNFRKFQVSRCLRFLDRDVGFIRRW